MQLFELIEHAFEDQLVGDELGQNHDLVVALVGLLGFFDAVREELVAALKEVEAGGRSWTYSSPDLDRSTSWIKTNCRSKARRS